MEETARREVREETGIEVSIDDAAYARRKTIVRKADSDRRLFMLTVVFDATPTRIDALDISDDELFEAGWLEEPPEIVDPFHEGRIRKWATSGNE